jgi:hypothetical protein
MACGPYDLVIPSDSANSASRSGGGSWKPSLVSAQLTMARSTMAVFGTWKYPTRPRGPMKLDIRRSAVPSTELLRLTSGRTFSTYCGLMTPSWERWTPCARPRLGSPGNRSSGIPGAVGPMPPVRAAPDRRCPPGLIHLPRGWGPGVAPRATPPGRWKRRPVAPPVGPPILPLT